MPKLLKGEKFPLMSCNPPMTLFWWENTCATCMGMVVTMNMDVSTHTQSTGPTEWWGLVRVVGTNIVVGIAGVLIVVCLIQGW